MSIEKDLYITLIGRLDNRIGNIEKRLGQIESILEYDKEVHNRLEKLEAYCALLKITDLRDIVTQYAEEAKKTFNKKPHKCPVCEGKRGFINDVLLPGEKLNRFQTQDETGVYDICRVCEGKGIVWG